MAAVHTNAQIGTNNNVVGTSAVVLTSVVNTPDVAET